MRSLWRSVIFGVLCTLILTGLLFGTVGNGAIIAFWLLTPAIWLTNATVGRAISTSDSGPANFVAIVLASSVVNIILYASTFFALSKIPALRRETKASVKTTAIIGAIIVIMCVALFGLKAHRCSQRRAAFVRQVESIKQGAHEHLTVGTKNAEVARFFSEHNTPVIIDGSYAYGSIRTTGCAPFGCSTDSAFISVRVKLDEAGVVLPAKTGHLS